MKDDEHIAHVVDETGVADARFVRGEPGTWTNKDMITIKPGGIIDFGSCYLYLTSRGELKEENDGRSEE